MNRKRNLVAFSCFDDPFSIAALLQREPAAFLWVVRLCKVLGRKVYESKKNVLRNKFARFFISKVQKGLKNTALQGPREGGFLFM